MSQSEAFPRLAKPASERFVKYVIEAMVDREKLWFEQFCEVDLAHTVMLAEQGIITKEQAAAILGTIKEIQQLGPTKFPTSPTLGSLLLQIEKFMSNKIGEDVAARMHTGRSRNDQNRTVHRCYARGRLLEIANRLLELQNTILTLAEKHVETIMPGYTHQQHATPITFGHYMISNFYAFHRDFQRLVGAYERTNLNALGAAALSGTPWPLDRHRTKELLGFDDLVVNSKDASGFAQDFPAEILGQLAILMSNLGRLAGDLNLWSTYEFGLVEVADEYCGSSSLMPQKKNAESLERLRDLAGKAVGWQASALGILKTATSSDCDPALDDFGLPAATKATSDMVDLMTGVLETLTVNVKLMKERAGTFWGTASNLADFIAKDNGLPFRIAHKIVGRLVRSAIEQGKRPGEITGEMVNRIAKETIGKALNITDDEVRMALDPAEFIHSTVTIGSVNPREVRNMLKDARGKNEIQRMWLSEQNEKLKLAAQKLNDAVEKYIEATH